MKYQKDKWRFRQHEGEWNFWSSRGGCASVSVTKKGRFSWHAGWPRITGGRYTHGVKPTLFLAQQIAESEMRRHEREQSGAAEVLDTHK